MFPHESVHVRAHAVSALRGISHHGLRRLQPFSGAKLPGKPLRIHARHHSGLSIGAYFQCLIMIAAVDQIKAKAIAVILPRVLLFEHEKRVHAIGGSARRRGKHKFSSGKCHAALMHLPRPGPVKATHKIIIPLKIHQQTG